MNRFSIALAICLLAFVLVAPRSRALNPALSQDRTATKSWDTTLASGLNFPLRDCSCLTAQVT